MRDSKNRNFRGGRRGGNRGPNQRGSASKVADTEAEKNNPFFAQFKDHATFLDKRHDKRERLVKLSRDITIESKRIIFLLHRIKQLPNDEKDESEENDEILTDDTTCDTRTEEADKIFQEAEGRFKELETDLWAQVATELADEDDFLYLKNYTAGLQEYVEALSFYHHLKHGEMVSWKEVQSRLSFPVLPTQDEEMDTEKLKVVQETPKDTSSLEDMMENISFPDKKEKTNKGEEELVNVVVPQADFMLGIADLTGEVMRQAINSAGAGNTETCFRLLNFLQEIHDGFVALRRDSHREVPSKLRVLRQSLRKVENVCYNINVRGSEVPKHLLGTYLGISGQLSDTHRSNEYTGGGAEEGYDFED